MVEKHTRLEATDISKRLLTSFIDRGHVLCQFGDMIDWNLLEKELAPVGGGIEEVRVPFRKIFGIFLLKQVFRLDDDVVLGRWRENPYWQYFCGENIFQYRVPFERSEFIHLRQCFHEEKILDEFGQRIDLFCKI